MTRDDIIRIAEDNGIVIIGEAMFRFAALVEKHVEHRMLTAMELYGRTERENGAAQEREACAKVCDSLHDKIELVEKTEHYPGEYGSEYDAGQGNAISECVDAIRARGEK